MSAVQVPYFFPTAISDSGDFVAISNGGVGCEAQSNHAMQNGTFDTSLQLRVQVEPLYQPLCRGVPGAARRLVARV